MGLLDRIVAMLTKLGQRGYVVHDDPAEYATWLDTDPDADTDGNMSKQIANHCLEATPKGAPQAHVRKKCHGGNRCN